ncbi:hypothetical protein, partial [Sunxiuqinia dokdonensis]|uniref:hypothetical protein n=1 Tax=Sunxiuqinia dokdonensis TaxID=1409788 RepID=UPI0012F7547B
MKKDYFSLKLTCCSRCWRFGLIFSSLTMGFMLMTAIAIAQTGNIQGIAPVISPTNGTAIDGNAYANWTKADTIINGVLQDWSTSGDIFYWGQVYPGPGAGVLDVIQRTPPQLDTIMAPMPYTPGVDKDTVIVYFDALSPGDPTTFTTDAKINQNPNVYTWGKGNVPPKNEIQNAGALFTWGDPSLTGIDGYPGNSDDLWCAFAGDRSAVNGSSYIDFEFLQAPLYMDTTAIKNGFPEGGFTSHGPDNGRTVGDYLVTVEFTGGGPHANVIVNRWTDIGGGNFEYQQVLSSEDDPMNGYPYGSILASVNTEKTYVHFPAFGQIEQVTLGQHHADGSYYKDTTLVLPYYVVNQWCEGAINVSSLFELNENPCFIVSTVFIRTRSSGESDQSQLKDIPGPPIQLNIVADPPVASCPSDPDIQACTSNEAIAEAYETWKAGFSYTGGTDPVTMISGDFPDLPTNPLCEGVDIEYEYIIEDFCGNRDSCSATFTVTAPDALVVNDGGDELDHLSCD